MGKLDDECEQRVKRLKRMNSLARDTQIAIDRHTKACEALKTVSGSFDEKAATIRAELERTYTEELAELQKGVNAAKSEVGTAAKLLRDVEGKFRASVELLHQALPVFLEDERYPEFEGQHPDEWEPDPARTDAHPRTHPEP